MLGRTLLIVVTTALVLIAASCSDGGFDDPDSDVVLEVTQVTVPPVTAAQDPLNPAICQFTITESSAQIDNIPKSDPVSGDFTPAQDVLITQLTISYVWDDGVVTPPSTTGPRVTIPADGTGQVSFLAIPINDLLTTVPSRDGHSAELTLVFNGTSESGNNVTALGGASLIINSCQ